MINTFRRSFRIRASISCNRLIFWLRRLPLVGRRIPAGLYADVNLKHTLVLLAEIITTLGAFVGKFLYLGLCCLLPCTLAAGGLAGESWSLFVQILFCLSFVAGCFLSSYLLEATLLKYTCVRQMGMNARAYLLSNLAWNHLLALLSFTPALMVCAWLLGQAPWTGLVLSLELAALRLVGEAFHLAVYRGSGAVLCKSGWYILILAGLALAGAYIPCLIPATLDLDRVLCHPAALALFLLAALPALAMVVRYPDYRALVNATCKAELVSTAAAKQKAAQAAFRDVQLRDSDLSAGADDRRLDRLRGYDYLNALFFRRHRRLLVRPVRVELILVGIVLALGLVGCLLIRAELASALSGIGSFLPALVFIMYLMGNSLGQRICKAMFYNCDISLLRYGWYRQRSVVLRNFWVRLRRVAGMNLLVAGALCLTAVVLVSVSGARPDPGELAAFLLCLLCLAVLFSVHPLFMYYIFQPYTTQLAMKNPFFGILNWVMYVVCYLCIRIDQPPQGFTLLVLCVTLLYIIGALLAVWRFAPRRFRVK